MLTMSLEQMERFARAKEERFLKELIGAATLAHPELVWMLGVEGFGRTVRDYYEEGKAFGLSYEYTLCRYTHWRLDHGEALLKESGWEFLRCILRDHTLAEEVKISEIDTILNGGPLRLGP